MWYSFSVFVTIEQEQKYVGINNPLTILLDT
jgi:hypothetical protein